jgi:hypothetical protein
MTRTLITLLPLPILLAATFFSSQLATWWYVHFDRPKFASTYQVTRQVSTFDSCASRDVPKRIDLAQQLDSPTDRTEQYVSPEGNITTIHCRYGKWQSTSTDCVAVQRQSRFSDLGFILFALGILKRSIRTGEWFNWPWGTRAPMSWGERILSTYGFGIFVVAMVAPSARCL